MVRPGDGLFPKLHYKFIGSLDVKSRNAMFSYHPDSFRVVLISTYIYN
jgi:hypothetical protein